MDTPFKAAWLRYIEAFGGNRPAQFTDPAHYDLSPEQREASWDLIRLKELEGSALDEHIHGRTTEQMLCDACQSLPAMLAREASKRRPSNRVELDYSLITHLQNAQSLFQTMHTCRVCALFSYVVRRQFRTGSLDDFAELTPEALLSMQLDILVHFRKRSEKALPQDSQRQIAAIELGIPWTRLKTPVVSIVQVL